MKKLNRNKYFTPPLCAIIFLFALTLAGCKELSKPAEIQGSGAIYSTTLLKNIRYGAGYVEDGGIPKARVWKAIELEKDYSDFSESKLKAITSNEAQWVAGGYLVENKIRYAALFTSTQIIKLTLGSSDENIETLAFAPSGALIAGGYQIKGIYRVACWWEISVDDSKKVTAASTIKQNFLENSYSDSGIKTIAFGSSSATPRTIFGGYIKESEAYYPVIWEKSNIPQKLENEGSNGGKRMPKASIESLQFLNDSTLVACGFVHLANKKWQSIYWKVEKPTAGSLLQNRKRVELTDGAAASRCYCSLIGIEKFYCGGYNKGTDPEWKASSWLVPQQAGATPSDIIKTDWIGGSFAAVIYNLYEKKSKLVGAGYLIMDIGKKIDYPVPVYLYPDGKTEQANRIY